MSIKPDPRNANKGTQRGRGLLEKSLRQYGAGRSVLADRNGVLIAGNKTHEVATEIGLPVRVIETDGNELVVVQRTDLDLSTDKAAVELGIADNRVGQVSLEWDVETLQAVADDGVDLSQFWHDYELAALLGGETDDPNAEWVGMPEFENVETKPAKQLIVNFRSEADLETFARLVDQRIVMSTKSIWYPFAEKQRFDGVVAWVGDDA